MASGAPARTAGFGGGGSATGEATGLGCGCAATGEAAGGGCGRVGGGCAGLAAACRAKQITTHDQARADPGAERHEEDALGALGAADPVLADRGEIRLVLDQDGYPQGSSPLYPSWHEHIATNWPVFYFEPFAKYFAA